MLAQVIGDVWNFDVERQQKVDAFRENIGKIKFMRQELDHFKADMHLWKLLADLDMLNEAAMSEVKPALHELRGRLQSLDTDGSLVLGTQSYKANVSKQADFTKDVRLAIIEHPSIWREILHNLLDKVQLAYDGMLQVLKEAVCNDVRLLGRTTHRS